MHTNLSSIQNVRYRTISFCWKWLLMKETWLENSKWVCGMKKCLPRHKETWWWNRDVEEVVAKRKVCHKALRKSKSAEDKHRCGQGGSIRSCAGSPSYKNPLQIFRVNLAGRTDSGLLDRWLKREEISSVCAVLKIKSEILCLMLTVWRKYMEKLINVENRWDDDVDCPEVMGPFCLISEEEVSAAIRRIKNLKTSWSYWCSE